LHACRLPPLAFLTHPAASETASAARAEAVGGSACNGAVSIFTICYSLFWMRPLERGRGRRIFRVNFLNVGAINIFLFYAGFCFLTIYDGRLAEFVYIA
jgi:hypothetical protein